MLYLTSASLLYLYKSEHIPCSINIKLKKFLVLGIFGNK